MAEVRISLKRKKVRVAYADDVRDWLAAKGYDPVYGARPLGRVIQEKIKDVELQDNDRRWWSVRLRPYKTTRITSYNVCYTKLLRGTPKGRLSKLEAALAERPWHQVRDGITVKLLPQEGECYVFAQSASRIDKERALRSYNFV